MFAKIKKYFNTETSSPKNISVDILFGVDCVDQPKIGLFLRMHIKKSLENAFSNLLNIPSINTRSDHYYVHTVFSSGNSMVFNAGTDKENIEDMSFKLSFRMLIDNNKQLGELSLKNEVPNNPFEFNYLPNKNEKIRKKEFKNKFDTFVNNLLKIKKEDVNLNIYLLFSLSRESLIIPYIMYELNKVNKISIPEFDILKENLNIMVDRLKSDKIIGDLPLKYLLNCQINSDVRWRIIYDSEYKDSNNNLLISKNTQVDILKEMARKGIVDSFILDQAVTEDNLNDVIDVLKSITY